MGAIANLTEDRKGITFGNDGVVIRHYGANIIGGRTLDVTGFENEEAIKCGHIIICETATNTYKPMPVQGGAYKALPEGHEYVGVLFATVPVKEPFAAIMYDGEVNDKACPYDVNSIKTALRTALPKLVFMHD